MKYERPKYDKYGMTQWYWLVRYRENFKLGENTEIGAFSVIDAENGVEIEDNVLVGFGVKILSVSTIDGKEGRVVLKKNCKIGSNSVIMPGVTIGENSVVGANSFVNGDIPPNEVWFGTPAKLIREVKLERP